MKLCSNLVGEWVARFYAGVIVIFYCLSRSFDEGWMLALVCSL